MYQRQNYTTGWYNFISIFKFQIVYIYFFDAGQNISRWLAFGLQLVLYFVLCSFFTLVVSVIKRAIPLYVYTIFVKMPT